MMDLIFLNHLAPITDVVMPFLNTFRPFALASQYIFTPYFGADLGHMDATVGAFIILYVGHAFLLQYCLGWFDKKTGLHPAKLHPIITQILWLCRTVYSFCAAVCLISAVACASLGIVRDVVLKHGPLCLFQADAGVYAKSALFDEAASEFVQVIYITTFLDLLFSVLLENKGLRSVSDRDHVRNVLFPLFFSAAHGAKADFMWIFVLINGSGLMLSRCAEFNNSNRDFLSKTLGLPKEISNLKLPFVTEFKSMRKGSLGVSGWPSQLDDKGLMLMLLKCFVMALNFGNKASRGVWVLIAVGLFFNTMEKMDKMNARGGKRGKK